MFHPPCTGLAQPRFEAMLPETIQEALTNGGVIFHDKDTIRLHMFGNYSIWIYPLLTLLKEAVHQRAMGMLSSDIWVNQGKPANSPLLIKEEALYQGYKALKAAINS